MPRVRRGRLPGRHGVNNPPPSGLPVRWAVIAIVATAAGAVGYVVGGPMAAIMASATVATTMHKLLA